MNFINLFSKKVALGLTIFSDFIWFVFGVFLTWQSVLLEISFWENIYESPALGIDQKWPYLCLLFGFGLMTLRLVQVYYRWIMLGEPILEERKDGENLEMETPHV